MEIVNTQLKSGYWQAGQTGDNMSHLQDPLGIEVEYFLVF